MIPDNILSRIHERCAVCPECGEKWLWIGNHADEPHRAAMEVNGVRYPVRKTLYRAAVGEPHRPCVTTTCQTACMNPAMLRAVSKAHIVKRSISEGKILNARHKMKVLSVIRSRNTKLDMEKADVIRCSDRSTRDLAKEYGVSRQTIHRVKTMQQWQPVGNMFAGLMA